MKKNIAIVWGGYSSEIVVSEKSMAGIYSFIDKEKYNIYIVKIDRNEWSSEIEGIIYPIDKNDFSISYKNSKIEIHFAYITIHGIPGEDGHLQGYLEMLKIPYSSCNVMASSLTFNKFICNKYLETFGVKVAKAIFLTKPSEYNVGDIVSKLGLPLFVKPNTGGSSFATTKVKELDCLQNAIDMAFNESSEVIIESFLDGREVTCGCYKTKQGSTLLPITEVITENDFFDYDAKYNGEVKEITPADLSDKMTQTIQQLTAQIYDWVGAKGIIRADFIISNGVPFLLEVNTTPGMTSTSFIPQQVAAAGLSMKNVLTEIIDNELSLRL